MNVDQTNVSWAVSLETRHRREGYLLCTLTLKTSLMVMGWYVNNSYHIVLILDLHREEQHQDKYRALILLYMHVLPSYADYLSRSNKYKI